MEKKTAEEILTPLRGNGNFINCIDFDDAVKAMEEYANQTIPKSNKYIVKEDMICPISKNHCDDECCTVGSECNISGDIRGIINIQTPLSETNCLSCGVPDSRHGTACGWKNATIIPPPESRVMDWGWNKEQLVAFMTFLRDEIKMPILYSNMGNYADEYLEKSAPLPPTPKD